MSGARTNAIGCVPEGDYKKQGLPLFNIAMFHMGTSRLKLVPPVDCPDLTVERR